MFEHAFSLTGFTGLSANVKFGGSCKIQRRGLCPSYNSSGDYVLVVKFMGDYVHIYKNEQGGCPGGGGLGWDIVHILWDNVNC